MKLGTALAFANELTKVALPGMGVASGLWRSHAGRAAAGGAVGAAGGAATNSEDRVGGAVRGGLLGAGAGLAAPLATKAGRRGARKGLKKFYEQQKQGFTGKGVDHNKLRLQEEVQKARTVVPKAGWIRTADEAKAHGVQKAEKALARHTTAEKANLTSYPGVYRALRKDPKKALGAGWRSMGGFDKAMFAGFTGLEAANLADRSTREGTAEKAMGLAAGTPAWMLSHRMGFMPSMLGMVGGHMGGSYIGKKIDELRGYKPPQQAVSSPTGGHQRTGRTLTAAHRRLAPVGSR